MFKQREDEADARALVKAVRAQLMRLEVAALVEHQHAMASCFAMPESFRAAAAESAVASSSKSAMTTRFAIRTPLVRVA